MRVDMSVIVSAGIISQSDTASRLIQLDWLGS